jgi:hypothetical protein
MTETPTTPRKTRVKKDHKGITGLVPSGFKLTAVEVTEPIRKQVRKDTGPRDDFQKTVDRDARANANHPKNKGKDTRAATGEKFYTDIKLTEYVVPAKAVDEVLHMLDRANTSGGPTAGMQKVYRRGTHASGGVRIQWAILKKAPAKPKPSAQPTADREG